MFFKNLCVFVPWMKEALTWEGLTLMQLVAKLINTKMMQKKLKMIETLAYGYSSESTQQDLSNKHQHDRV